MEFTLQQISALLNGKLEGNPDHKISTVAKIQEAEPHTITFLSNPKYENFVYDTRAGAVIVNTDFVPKKEINTSLIFVDDAYTAFTSLLDEYYRVMSFAKHGVEEPAFMGKSTIGSGHYRGAFSYIGNNCTIGDNVKIYPHAYIGDNVKIGNNVIIHSGVKIYADTVIGNYCTLHSGTVIGSDGFGFAPQADGSYKTIPQIGNVILEDHVNIGANTVIDCATMGSTVIEKGVKLDNLIQIAHNVRVGEHTVIAAQTGVSGSTTIGAGCMIGGQVGIVGHISIAPKTKIGAQSGIGGHIKEPGTAVQGSPAFDYNKNLRASAVFRKLPDLMKRIEKLEEKVITLPDLKN